MLNYKVHYNHENNSFTSPSYFMVIQTATPLRRYGNWNGIVVVACVDVADCYCISMVHLLGLGFGFLVVPLLNGTL